MKVSGRLAGNQKNTVRSVGRIHKKLLRRIAGVGCLNLIHDVQGDFKRIAAHLAGNFGLLTKGDGFYKGCQFLFQGIAF